MKTNKIKNPKPPFKILLEDPDGNKTESKSYSCGECMRVYSTKEEAQGCCKISVCSCGKDIERDYYTVCDDCSSLNDAKRELERWEKMPEETDWGGPILSNDIFYGSIDELTDGEDGDLPEYVECCDTKKLGYNVNPDRVIEHILEDMLDNVEDSDYFESKIVDTDSLYQAIRSFLEAQTSELWVPNGKKVAIPQATSK